MSLLMRNATVTTRYSGGFVQSIDGLSGGQRRRTAGRLVLLRQRRRGAPGRGGHERAPGRSHLVGPPRLEPDRRRARGGRVVSRAVPERARRQAAAGARRMRARDRLRVPHRHRAAARRWASPPRSRRSAAAAARRRRCAWRWRRGPQVEGDPSVHGIELGPRSSGVYARFSADGSTLTLLDQNGRSDPHARRGRGADRGDRQRRRRARVGRHRDRRRGCQRRCRAHSTRTRSTIASPSRRRRPERLRCRRQD